MYLKDAFYEEWLPATLEQHNRVYFDIKAEQDYNLSLSAS